ncbi:hypothetical protein B0J13DRAFT_134397 [Dactylonectria estremocensis]|uniref:Uncharacterized protein n=1 Tax=Dactylonectria estremocensis TaxID=1079267 RepID=A0A9P9E3D8_9HYPO|nr:hypothetical protein B0J13DRAFT_134397 [Dactylonectria estremocensis]
MLQLAPWAVLAMAPLAQADFDWLHPQRHAEECCPCPMSGATDYNVQTVTISEHAQRTHTVTVTEPAGYPSKQTVVIERTITLPGKTVYYTQVEQHTVTEKVSNSVAPSYAHKEEHYDKTTTITYGLPSQSANKPTYDDNEVVVKTITIGGEKEEEHYHVTTITEGGNYQVTTITLHSPQETDEVVEIIKTVTIQYSDERVLTKIVQDGDKHYTAPFGNSDGCVTKTIYEAGKHYTIVIKPEPSVQTFTEEGGKATTKTVEVYRTATITAPAQTQTITEQEYRTITTTMIDSYGQPDVQIIVVHIETGKSTCKKKLSGLPCHDGDAYEYPEVSDMTETDCSISTSIETVYHTVVKTVGPGGAAVPEAMGSSTTTEGLQQPMSSHNIQVQQPRYPRSIRW